MTAFNRRVRRSLYILKYEGVTALVSEIRKKLFGTKKGFESLQAEMLALPTAKDRFSKIYSDNIWGGIESLSGPGSTPKYTQNLRKELPQLISRHKIASIVDAACGDFAWMNLVLKDLDVNYIGCDIVDSVIKRNIDLFSGAKLSFLVKDISTDSLPDADLVVVRDVLFHLSFKDINNFLNNLKQVDYRYLLTTTHLIDDPNFRNADIETGDFRKIDMFSPPFRISPEAVLEEIEDYVEGTLPRKMILLAKSNVPTSLSSGTT